jgi:hypothetical protein
MSMMSNLTDKILILTVLLVLLPVETLAFGAGDIPDFAYLNGLNFCDGLMAVLNVVQTRHSAMAILRISSKKSPRLQVVSRWVAEL